MIPDILHLQHQALGNRLNKLWPTFFLLNVFKRFFYRATFFTFLTFFLFFLERFFTSMIQGERCSTWPCTLHCNDRRWSFPKPSDFSLYTKAYVPLLCATR